MPDQFDLIDVLCVNLIKVLLKKWLVPLNIAIGTNAKICDRNHVTNNKSLASKALEIIALDIFLSRMDGEAIIKFSFDFFSFYSRTHTLITCNHQLVS